MKCQMLFSGKNKKNITKLLSAELAKRVVKVNKSSESQYEYCISSHNSSLVRESC